MKEHNSLDNPGRWREGERAFLPNTGELGIIMMGWRLEIQERMLRLPGKLNATRREIAGCAT